MQEKHLFLEFSSNIRNKEELKNNLVFPPKAFPRSFSKERGDFIIFGYFASYEKDLNLEKAVGLAIKGKFRELVKYNADFLILVFNEKEGRLSVVVDQTSKFRLYFGFSDGKYLISTEFALLKKKLVKFTLNINSVLDHLLLTDMTSFGINTIVNEIYLLPACSLLTIKDGKWKIESLFDLENISNHKIKSYLDIREYREELLQALNASITSRLKAIYPNKIGTELSSGFDSSLVSFLVKKNFPDYFPSFTLVSGHPRSETKPEIVKNFAKKYGLDAVLIPIDALITFSDFNLDWIKERFYPNSHETNWAEKIYSQVKEYGINVLFNGYGGDELYKSSKLNDEIRFQMQFSYQFSVLNPYTAHEFDTLYTKKGIAAITDTVRFSQKDFFPVPVAASCISCLGPTFSLYWENDVWPISPFIDTRVIEVAKRLPINCSSFNKQDILKGYNIFLPEQYKSKEEGRGQIEPFLRVRAGFIKKVLKNSLLGDMGWIKAKEISDNIESGNIEPYRKEEIAVQLTQILVLEHFLQENNISL